LREGSTKFLAGVLLGALGGFAAGSFVTTPAARSAGHSLLGGLGISARHLGSALSRAADGLATTFESGYTRLRGREAYLEREIEELREQIENLEGRRG